MKHLSNSGERLDVIEQGSIGKVVGSLSKRDYEMLRDGPTEEQQYLAEWIVSQRVEAIRNAKIQATRDAKPEQGDVLPCLRNTKVAGCEML